MSQMVHLTNTGRSRGGPPAGKQHRLLVFDPKAYTAPLRALVEAIGKRRTAKILGVTRRQIDAWLRKAEESEPFRVAEYTHQRLAKALPIVGRPDLIEAFEAATLSPPARARREQHEMWLTRQTGLLFPSAKPIDEAELMRLAQSGELQPLPLQVPPNARRQRLQALMEKLRALYPVLFADFDAKLRAFGCTAGRRLVAYERVVGPLLDAEDSGGVELGWSELLRRKRWQGKHGPKRRETNDLLIFLERGMRRELLLLDRPTDMARAQALASREVK